MLKFSQEKAISSLKAVLILLVGIIGAKALKGIVEAKFPQFASYTNYGVLAAALAGTMVVNPIVQQVAKGSLLFGAVQLINQLAPGSKYLPQLTGLRGLGNYPVAQIPQSAITLGNQVQRGVGNMVL